MKFDPRPTELSTVRSPPIARARSRLIDSPSPTPCALLACDGDPAAGRRELDRVRQEVEQDLLETVGVRRDGQIARAIVDSPESAYPRNQAEGVSGACSLRRKIVKNPIPSVVIPGDTRPQKGVW